MKRIVYTYCLLGFILASTYLARGETYPSKIESEQEQTINLSSPSPNQSPSVINKPSPTPAPQVESASTGAPQASPAPAINSNSTLNATLNIFRQQNYRSQLSIDSTICDWANQRANEITNNFSHEGFDRGNPLARIGAHSAAENIASSAKGAVFIVNEMWAKSAGHRENMLGDFTRGCGVIKGRYAVYIFAS